MFNHQKEKREEREAINQERDMLDAHLSEDQKSELDKDLMRTNLWIAGKYLTIAIVVGFLAYLVLNG